MLSDAGRIPLALSRDPEGPQIDDGEDCYSSHDKWQYSNYLRDGGKKILPGAKLTCSSGACGYAMQTMRCSSCRDFIPEVSSHAAGFAHNEHMPRSLPPHTSSQAQIGVRANCSYKWCGKGAMGTEGLMERREEAIVICEACSDHITCDSCGKRGCGCRFVQCSHAGCEAMLCNHTNFNGWKPDDSGEGEVRGCTVR